QCRTKRQAQHSIEHRRGGPRAAPFLFAFNPVESSRGRLALLFARIWAVPPDDLNAPLGQDKPKKRPIPAAIPQIFAGTLALLGIAVIAWAIIVNDPLGGEPTAVAAISSPTKKPDPAS